VLENVPPRPHIIEMAETHPFTIRVEPDLLRDGRFRWTLYENGQPRNQSIVSYGTKRDADAAIAHVPARALVTRRMGSAGLRG
jgi:hypothetical protein